MGLRPCWDKLSQRRNNRKRRQKKKEEDEVEKAQEKEEEEEEEAETAAAAQSVIKRFKKVLNPSPSGKHKVLQLWDSISPLSEWPTSRKLPSSGEDMGKEKSLFTAGRNVNKYHQYRNQSRQLPKTTKKNRIAVWLSYNSHVYTPRELLPHRYLHIHIHYCSIYNS